MKPDAIIFQKIIKAGSLSVALFTFNCLATNAQVTRLKPTVYNNYIRSGSTVKIQTLEGERIRKTDTSVVNNIQLQANKKNVIKYENKIAVLEGASMQKFREAAKTTATNEEIKVIPELHVEPDSGQADPIAYRIVFTSLQPLHYNDSLKKFTANLAFLLMNESGDNTAHIDPVKIEVNSDDATFIKPRSFAIDHLSIPSSDVELIADNVNDSASIKVITVSNPLGYITYLKVKPTLELFSNRDKMQGLGIQQIPITVSFSGSKSFDSVSVIFSPGKGTVSPNPLKMKYNETATAYLRSEGMGKSLVTATANSIKSNPLYFTYTFPWPFLLATILGGLAGSFIKQNSKSTRKKITFKVILVGIVTGFIGAAAYYVLGINLLGLSFSAAFNEIAVFVISALFAYFGIMIVKPGTKE
jgi:hypothetical protein